jgi:hypothetical protein
MTTQENDLEIRLATLEKQLSTLLIALGGKRNDEQPIPTTTTNATPAATANDWS